MASIEINFGELFKDALFKLLYHDRQYAEKIAADSLAEGFENGWGDDGVETITGIASVPGLMRGSVRIDFITEEGRIGAVLYDGDITSLLNELVFRT